MKGAEQGVEYILLLLDPLDEEMKVSVVWMICRKERCGCQVKTTDKYIYIEDWRIDRYKVGIDR